DHPRTSDLIAERQGLVTAVLPRDAPREQDHRNLVPAGIYLAKPDFFRRLLPDIRADMIHDVLPALITSGERVAAYNTPEYMRDIGTEQRHAMAERDIVGGRVEALNCLRRRPAVFFDCDGVLNDEPGIHGAVKPDDIVLMPGAATAVRRA